MNLLTKCKLIVKEKKNHGTIPLKQLFFQSTFKAQLKTNFKNLRPHFQNSFVPACFNVFCARLQNGTQKPNSSVLLSSYGCWNYWHVTGYSWHVTCDMLRVKPDTTRYISIYIYYFVLAFILNILISMLHPHTSKDWESHEWGIKKI